jgi:hypothetical protein
MYARKYGSAASNKTPMKARYRDEPFEMHTREYDCTLRSRSVNVSTDQSGSQLDQT